MTTETAVKRRDEILSEIAKHEECIERLRVQLPDTLKSFFRFRVHPGKFSWAYAYSRDEAEQIVTARMDKDYGDEWRFTSPVMDQYNDPQIACGANAGNLLQYLPEENAIEFISDWKANKAGKTEAMRRTGYRSRIELDIAQYEQILRQRDQR